MSVKVKICGITNEKDAVAAVNLGAHYLGFNFYSQSPRKVSVAMAADVIKKVPPFIISVGVFVDDPVEEVVKTVKKTGLRGIQLHGEQSHEDVKRLGDALPGVFIMRAFRVKEEADLASAGFFKDVCQYFLIDARVDDALGGTGETFPWELAQKAKDFGLPLFVAGGLTPENVREAIEITQPFAVDVASGIEKSPKRKDYDKMKKFMEEVRRA